jgi:hypothetical protein
MPDRNPHLLKLTASNLALPFKSDSKKNKKKKKGQKTPAGVATASATKRKHESLSRSAWPGHAEPAREKSTKHKKPLGRDG